MAELWEDLWAGNFPFLRYALLMVLLCSPTVGLAGAIATAQRLGYLVAAISHASLGGVAAALWLQVVVGWGWSDPALGALIVGLLAAFGFGWCRQGAPAQLEPLIGAVWAVGMAGGLLILARIPGYLDPMSYLFGDILLLSVGDLWMGGGLAAVVVGLGAWRFRQIEAVCFDPDFAQTRGVPVGQIRRLVELLLAVVAVLLTLLVGIVLVVALISLPTAIAQRWSRSFGELVLWGSVASAVTGVGGILLSYAADLPTGPTMILTAAAAYLVSLGWPRRAAKN